MYAIYERLRDDKGVTDYRVAAETGISRSTLSEWKRGKYEPKVDKLIRIANYFGISVEELLKSE